MTIAGIDPGAATSGSSPTWAHELETWKNITAHSPIWDDIETFIEEIRSIASAKVAEREAGRNALRTALEGLCGDFAAELVYFEASAAGWAAEAVPYGEAQGVATRVSELHSELVARKNLQEQPAAHYSEARRLRDQVNSVEDTIFGHLAALGEQFGAVDVSGSGAGSRAEPERNHSVAPLSGQAASKAQSVSSLPPMGSIDSLSSIEEIDAHVLPLAPSAQEPASAKPAEVDRDQPEEDTSQGDLHRPLETHGWYSPLTAVQEHSIVKTGSGVGLIFASGALGFEHLPEAVTRLTATIEGGAFSPVPPSVSTGDAVHAWIADFVQASGQNSKIIFAQPVVVSSPEIVDRIEGALKYRAENPNTAIRFLFFLAPGAVSGWLELSPESRAALESRLEPIIHLAPWTSEAVRDRLAREGKQQDDETVALAMAATGGWSWCVDKLFENCGENPDPRPAIADTLKRLSDGDLHDEFLMRIGVRPDTLQDKVLQLILTEEEVLADLIGPELEGEGVNQDACRQALEFLEAVSCAMTTDEVVRLDPFLARVLKSA